MAATALCPTELPLPPRRAPIAPLPPAMWTRTRHALGSPILWRWIILSMLLHVLAILLFGSPTGGSKEGRAMWGRLSVVIKEGWRDTGPDLRLEREIAPKPAAVAPARPKEVRKPAPKAPPPPPVDLGVSKELTPVPPLLDRLPPQEPKQELAPAPKVPPPVEAPPAPVAPPPPLDRVTAPRIERTLVEPPPTPPAPVPLPPPTPPSLLDRVNAPRVERPLLEPPPTPPAPVPLPAPAPPSMMDRVNAPRIERQLAEPPPMPAPVVQQPVPAPMPREVVKPDPLPGPLPGEGKISAPAPAQAAPPVQAPPAAQAPAAPPSPAASRPAETPAPSPRAAPTAPATRDALPSHLPGERAPERPFRAPAEPPSHYDPTAAPPSLDLDGMRKRAGELGRAGTGNRAALPFPMPPVPEKKSKLEEAIDKARKPDCREAYKHFGLAAVVPLIANEFGEGKCKW